MNYIIWSDTLEQEIEISFEMETQYNENCYPQENPTIVDFKWNKRFYTETQNVIIANEIELQKDNILSELLDNLNYSI
jgi:hypothetical protein